MNGNLTGLTLNEIAEDLWGRPLIGNLPGRFSQPGWAHDSSVADTCPQCQTPLECCRKPYQTAAGRHQKYVALLCGGCFKVLTLKDLALGGFAGLTPRLRDSTEPEPDPVRTHLHRPDQIISYWRAMEYFEVQSVELPDRTERAAGPRSDRQMIALDGLAPWAQQPEARNVENRKVTPAQDAPSYSYTLFIGLFELAAMQRAMGAAIATRDAGVEERVPRGHSALFSLSVNHHGVPNWESLSLASAPWALGRLLRTSGEELDLNGFTRDQQEFAEQVTTRFGSITGADQPDEDADPQALDAADVGLLIKLAVTYLGLEDVLDMRGAVANRRIVRDVENESHRDGFLNTLLAEDLDRVAVDVRLNGAQGAMAGYLGRQHGNRLDVRDPAARPEIEQRLQPVSLPAGRWPSNPKNSLSTSQQLAVNSISQMSQGPDVVFGVNGPPGTGKSTLLRDVIADQITQRAMVLAECVRVEDAFDTVQHELRVDKWTHRFSALHPKLTGFEMVVASSNNGAVENVSRELPLRDELDDLWRDSSYLAAAAHRIDANSWGLISAVLGRKANRAAFVSTCWWGSSSDRGNRPGPALHTEMSDLAKEATPADWSNTIAAFKKAHAREAKLRSERQMLFDDVQRLPAMVAESRQVEKRLHRASALYERNIVEVRNAQEELDVAQTRLSEFREVRQRMLAEKPTTWAKLRYRKKSTLWRHLFQEHEQWGQALTGRRDAGESVLEEHAASLNDVAAELTEVRSALATARRQLAEAELRISNARESQSVVIPDLNWWADSARQELDPVWVDRSWNEARSELFIAAMQLHEQFIVSAWKSHFANGIGAAMELIAGKVPHGSTSAAVTEAWRYLFLMVPVISTTFASLGSMFHDVKAESMGWLIVDEAGQAVPQAAVGGIWRSKKVVAVGDPLQLEPIVAAPVEIQELVRRAWDVSEEWMPGRGSVQRLADQATNIGTSVLENGEDLWVGAPLRAHRRCDEPMFSVFNDSVYDGSMVQGAPARAGHEPLNLPLLQPSAWFDVPVGPANQADGKWRPEEGENLIHLVEYVLKQPVDAGPDGPPDSGRTLEPKDVLVIAPFKQVADRAKRLLNKAGVPLSGDGSPGVTVGTVHTAQGKDASVVIFILGSDPASPGARQWAAATPNLMNVAVSRAKHRIFVIGQREQWAGLPYFKELAAALPVIVRQGSGSRSSPPTDPQ